MKLLTGECHRTLLMKINTGSCNPSGNGLLSDGTKQSPESRSRSKSQYGVTNVIRS